MSVSKIMILLVGLMLLTAPMALAEEHGEEEDGDEGPPKEAHWGLCNAQEASQPGDEASNGTVSATSPFQEADEEDCETAERPGNGTVPGGPPESMPGPDDHPDDEENPGDEHRPDDQPDGDENPGDEHRPDDQPDEEGNPGDNRRP